MRSFAPVDGGTFSRTTTTSSSRVAIPTGILPGGEYQLRVYNSGTDLAFIRLGDAAVEAAATDYPVPGGMVEVITVNNPARAADAPTNIAAIASAGTPTMYFTIGHGI